MPASIASLAAASTSIGGTIAIDAQAPVVATTSRQVAKTCRPGRSALSGRAEVPPTILVP
jgi:hypothetical protein